MFYCHSVQLYDCEDDDETSYYYSGFRSSFQAIGQSRVIAGTAFRMFFRALLRMSLGQNALAAFRQERRILHQRRANAQFGLAVGVVDDAIITWK